MGEQSRMSTENYPSDETLAATRREINEIDQKLLELLNRRLDIVRTLHEHKVRAGLPLRDMAREESMVEQLVEANTGTLSPAGVRRFFTHLLDLIREEIHGA